MIFKTKKALLLSLCVLMLLGNTPMDTQAVPMRFAVIGDYGLASQPEQDVATLVNSWNPDFIVTLGDNNYTTGSAAEIDANIGQYYHDYIYPYQGSYGAGAAANKFFPILGNHDWETPNAQPYLDYFSLPGNERYYDFIQGPIHFFVLDSDPREPDGTSASSIQALWLKAGLYTSTSPWQIVLLHHAPYSSSSHGSNTNMQWDYKGWGADAVLAGHDHTYERIVIDGLPYFVNGLGGSTIYPFNTPVTGSEVRYNNNYGAMLITALDTQITFQFWSRTPTKRDEYILQTTFADVAKNYWAWSFIESLKNANITGGCLTTPLSYCPEDSVTRAQMAVFLLKGIHGSTYIPPVVGSDTGFADVAADHWAAAWIKQLAAEGITSGCGAGNYCPENSVTRAQMAIFLLNAKYGSAYEPPAPTGVFTDVPIGYWADQWIEQLAFEGITSGCGSGIYCPEADVTRAQMAVFLVKTFGLP
ncbi:MAG: S-layer homology domain-containing protein [Anaerolineales bacterium]|uniref:S-layer homology domain-containing protein n=1 Tax=Candidatus Villigracilis proximus TaxID=3140683 RepID=UPI00313675B2|nr:S-layer homology domain-containing protein [Anaerolineales bacterium]